jgi:diguanylate cyclase (GGDEF)-like protein
MGDITDRYEKAVRLSTDKFSGLVKRVANSADAQSQIRADLESLTQNTGKKDIALSTFDTLLKLHDSIPADSYSIFCQHARGLFELILDYRNVKRKAEDEAINQELSPQNLEEMPTEFFTKFLMLGDIAREKQELASKLEIENKTLKEEAKKNEEQTKIYRNKAIRDGLTGLLNKEYFGKKFEEETKEAQKYGRPLSLILFDIDFFKKINDTYGHQAGDYVLRALPDVLELRHASDLVGRIGGEEFAILLPETPEKSAKAVAERIRQKAESYHFDYENKKLPVTLSLGVGQYAQGETFQQFMKRVDNLQYMAKNSGRNATCSYEDWNDMQSEVEK